MGCLLGGLLSAAVAGVWTYMYHKEIVGGVTFISFVIGYYMVSHVCESFFIYFFGFRTGLVMRSHELRRLIFCGKVCIVVAEEFFGNMWMPVVAITIWSDSFMSIRSHGANIFPTVREELSFEV